MAIPAIVGLLGRALGAVAGSPTNLLAGMQGVPTAAPVRGAGGGSLGAAAGLAKGFSQLGFAAQGVSASVGLVTGTLSKMAGAAGALTSPLSVGVDLLGSFRDGVTALGSQVSQFTALANPALTQRFQFAAEDLTAVIGKSLLPVLEFATKYTRGFADVIQALSAPISRLLSAALKPLGDLIPYLTDTIGGPFVSILTHLADAATRVLRPFMSIAATFVKLSAFNLEVVLANFAGAMEVLLVPLEVGAALMSEFARAFDTFVTESLAGARRLLGIPAAKLAGGSVGAAVKSTSITSAEEYQKKVFAQAFALGSASSSSPEVKTSAAAEAILSWLKTAGAGIAADVSKFLNLPAAVADALWSHIKDMPGVKEAREAGGALAAAARGDGGAAVAALGPAAAVTGRPAAALVLEGGRRLDEERKKAARDPVGYLFGR
jgi:hypothetical protein